jgi:lipoate-protein ligase B
MNSNLQVNPMTELTLKKDHGCIPGLKQKLASEWAGLIDIEQGFVLQEQFLNSADLDQIQVIGCEHFEVLSFGKSAWGSDTSEWRPYFNQFHKTHRGGKLTLHNPGQLIVYPSLHLKSYNLSIKNYVQLLLEITQKCLKEFGLNTDIQSKDNIGLFIGPKKIGSIGLRCQKGWVSHGLAINVANDLEKFKLFDVCGQASAEMTSMKIEGHEVTTHEVFLRWTQILQTFISGL